MSHMQKRVIQEYQTKFPNHTLKEIASQTSINMSRVFRIFNGYEMKISEYEKFQKALSPKASTQEIPLVVLGQKCEQKLSAHHMNQLRRTMIMMLRQQSFMSESRNLLSSEKGA